MNDEFRKRIIRAAVAWERAKHVKLGPYEVSKIEKEEKELAESVQEYNRHLLIDDVGEGILQITPIMEPADPLKFIDR